MNDQGHIAGTFLLVGDENRAAFLRSNDQMTDLGSLGNATDAFAIKAGVIRVWPLSISSVVSV